MMTIAGWPAIIRRPLIGRHRETYSGAVLRQWCPTASGCRFPQTSRHSKAIGHLTALSATWGDPRNMAPGKLVHLAQRHLVARDQELSGIESFISIASKTAAMA